MTLAQAIIDYRTRMGISQREFARRCNLSHGTIPILEQEINRQTGKRPTPDIQTYKKVADGMGITLQELLEMLDKTELVSLGTAMTDSDRLEALHQNPKLCLLFDRQRRMSDEDIEIMLSITDRIVKENYGD